MPAFYRYAAATLLVFLVTGGAASMAQTPPPAPRVPAEFSPIPSIWAPSVPGEQLAPRLARDDRVFIREAMASNRFWIEASRLAMDKARRPQIKALARDSLDHHMGANARLMQIARSRGLTPTMLNTDQRKILNKLAKTSGSKFDAEYLNKVVIKDHREEIWLYEKTFRDSKDVELQGWIEDNLPALRTHLVLAEDAARRAEGKPARTGKV
jgi:putative membrane protein